MTPKTEILGPEIDLLVWARQEIRNHKRARRLAKLNTALVPVSCLVSVWIAWEVWHAFR